MSEFEAKDFVELLLESDTGLLVGEEVSKEASREWIRKLDNFKQNDERSLETISHLSFSFHWNFWQDSSSKPGENMDATKFAQSQMEIGVEVYSVETFCCEWNKMARTNIRNVFGVYSNLRLFKQGIRPLWEDPSNKKGGRWVIRVKVDLDEATDNISDQYSRMFLRLLIHMVTGQLSFEDDMCGAALTIKPNTLTLSLWNKDSTNTKQIDYVTERLYDLLKPEKVEYWSHAENRTARMAAAKKSEKKMGRRTRRGKQSKTLDSLPRLPPGDHRSIINQTSPMISPRDNTKNPIPRRWTNPNNNIANVTKSPKVRSPSNVNKPQQPNPPILIRPETDISPGSKIPNSPVKPTNSLYEFVKNSVPGKLNWYEDDDEQIQSPSSSLGDCPTASQENPSSFIQNYPSTTNNTTTPLDDLRREYEENKNNKKNYKNKRQKIASPSKMIDSKPLWSNGSTSPLGTKKNSPMKSNPMKRPVTSETPQNTTHQQQNNRRDKRRRKSQFQKNPNEISSPTGNSISSGNNLPKARTSPRLFPLNQTPQQKRLSLRNLPQAKSPSGNNNSPPSPRVPPKTPSSDSIIVPKTIKEMVTKTNAERRRIFQQIKQQSLLKSPNSSDLSIPLNELGPEEFRELSEHFHSNYPEEWSQHPNDESLKNDSPQQESQNLRVVGDLKKPLPEVKITPPEVESETKVAAQSQSDSKPEPELQSEVVPETESEVTSDERSVKDTPEPQSEIPPEPKSHLAPHTNPDFDLPPKSKSAPHLKHRPKHKPEPEIKPKSQESGTDQQEEDLVTHIFEEAVLLDLVNPPILPNSNPQTTKKSQKPKQPQQLNTHHHHHHNPKKTFHKQPSNHNHSPKIPNILPPKELHPIFQITPIKLGVLFFVIMSWIAITTNP